MTRRAKIVCTIGPATASAERLRALVDAGMNVARLNFSHGAHADHEGVYKRVREAAEATGIAVGVLADLQGPKIRLGKFADGPTEWKTGEVVSITTDDIEGDHDRVSTTYKKLAAEVAIGDRLLIDDGKLALEVTGVEGNDIRCLVLEGGPISNNKGLSLPNVKISVPALSEKDAEDLRFALRLGVDMIALSFVRSPDDIKLVHAIMDEEGRRVPVIAKIEKPEAVEYLEQIVLAFDALMVARGDLGVELPLEQVPLVQKRAIQMARENAKPVIVATQMLDSMIENSRPTRAETSDVANAVLDGADAVMLSAETSVGRYPVLTVRTMAKIVETAEESRIPVPPLQHAPKTQGGAIAAAARQIGEVIEAKALVAFTLTGDTVRRVARLHTGLPLLAFTPIESVRNQLALSWGVETFLSPSVEHTDDMVAQVDSLLQEAHWANHGDSVVIVAGTPPNEAGATNTVRVHRIGSLR
ncbi:pyruvate kinase [Cryptosporangium sp. NPDC051539]|uniref:pyruvate kinase n=1 Tax=Cryptosporangium sp. NPDC051539 TaxID=3363962 RepID=UPI0037A29A3B